MRFWLKMILLLSLLTPSVATAAEKIVALATLTDFVPFCFKKENAVEIAGEMIPPGSDSQQLQGYSWDVVRESFHVMGYTVKLYVVPWERAVHYLNTGKVDAIFPANRTTEREKEILFSQGIVDEMRMVVYVPVDSPVNWGGLESLNGLRVAAVRGWAYGEAWAGNQYIIKEKTDTILQSFEVLDKNRLTGVVGYEAAYDYVLKQQKIMQKYRKVGPFETIREYLMIRKVVTAGDSVIDIFDQGRERIAKNGTLTALTSKWL